ncbi:16S rRNA (guanine(966)-N(2))-methyltransferase RsmD [Campylobacter novaezeelandiae]|uniref:RsmD family RNA methyltransferase n=1 Tax=Campylobacter novaezeelandiae TaxID=2267891 RepID=UPI001037C36A|nr:RsmD family RNA methyltransferase [Campylobacter novaezeelandiae]TBR82629.1 16S rRNA (guanine(966)-N(2))-methyltransferase RsmD [Campylobacter novaezeelandiae]
MTSKTYLKERDFKRKNSKKLYTIIESGKFKGKKLLLPSLSTTRSTKSIVKACVFNVLRDILRDKIFIEVFGGSALMAAEALSNEALKAYAIELDYKAYHIALQNAKNISDDLVVLQGDSFKVLPYLLCDLNAELILYFDPPFDIREGFDGIYERVYELIKNLNTSHIVYIIIEHYSLVKTPQNLGIFNLIKIKKFGSTSLSFYTI